MTSPARNDPGKKEGAVGKAPSPADRKPMLLRVDPQVHAALTKWAADDLRSTNAHVEWLLRQALSQAGRLPPSKASTLGVVPDPTDNTPQFPALPGENPPP